MDKQIILNSLKELEDIVILHEEAESISLFDEANGKELTYYFNEYVTPKNLAKRVYVSRLIPENYKGIFDKGRIVDALLNKIDRNCLLTMNALFIIHDNEGDEEDFEDNKDRIALMEHVGGDEYASEVGLGNIGVTWWEKNICIINAARIIATSQDTCEELDGNDYYVQKETEIGMWTTIIHELRHLLLDTNIILPEDEYPVELAVEEAVEEYCRAYYEGVFLK